MANDSFRRGLRMGIAMTTGVPESSVAIDVFECLGQRRLQEDQRQLQGGGSSFRAAFIIVQSQDLDLEEVAAGLQTMETESLALNIQLALEEAGQNVVAGITAVAAVVVEVPFTSTSSARSTSAST
eukprot:138510-Amphidinium_carterae.1